MKKNKFIGQVESFFGGNLGDEATKEEMIGTLVKKLEARYTKLKSKLKKTSSKEKQEDIKESLVIIKKQIKKGKKLLK